MGSSSSFDDYSSPASFRGEMCMEIGGAGRGRRGRSTAADGSGKTNTTKQKQPQRGLGVAQLEKIRLHNQMLAAYRSAAAQQQLHDHQQGHDVDADADASATMIPAGPSFQPPFHHLTNRCLEETDHDHRGVAVHYYDGLLPTTPSLYVHDVRDSLGHRLGQPPQQQHYSWMMSSGSDVGASAEELDLELRL